MFLPEELIKKKKQGKVHTAEEIHFLVDAYVKNELPDYQMGAWLMAIYFQEMNKEEINHFTQAIIDSGKKLDFGSHIVPVDKHSTGGVGDKTSIILAPIVAACGVPVPMIAGRGLGHTGGTLDKLESIEGFSVNMSLEQFKRQVETINLSIIGQTDDLCPADKKIYALRDVTGTVDSLPLICASIMSKKIIEGIKGLVLDVKVGTGAFMKSLEEAQSLAEYLMAIGDAYKIEVTAFLTNMNQPLGRYAGNALEIIECVDILQGKTHLVDGVDSYDDTRRLSLQLAGEMLRLGQGLSSTEEGITRAKQVLESGEAYEKLLEVIKSQGGKLKNGQLVDNSFLETRYDVCSPREGCISGFKTEAIGISGIVLKAGRSEATDMIDYTAGVEIHKKTGSHIQKGEPLFSIYGADQSLFKKAEDILLDSIIWSEEETSSSATPLIYKTLHSHYSLVGGGPIR